jgi:hypothetical protein
MGQSEGDSAVKKVTNAVDKNAQDQRVSRRMRRLASHVIRAGHGETSVEGLSDPVRARHGDGLPPIQCCRLALLPIVPAAQLKAGRLGMRQRRSRGLATPRW